MRRGFTSRTTGPSGVRTRSIPIYPQRPGIALTTAPARAASRPSLSVIALTTSRSTVTLCSTIRTSWRLTASSVDRPRAHSTERLAGSPSIQGCATIRTGFAARRDRAASGSGAIAVSSHPAPSSGFTTQAPVRSGRRSDAVKVGATGTPCRASTAAVRRLLAATRIPLGRHPSRRRPARSVARARSSSAPFVSGAIGQAASAAARPGA